MWKIAGKKFWAMAKAKITCLTSERSEWGVVIFAAIAKEFPAIFHQRAIFLCQAFFSSLKRKRMLLPIHFQNKTFWTDVIWKIFRKVPGNAIKFRSKSNVYYIPHSPTPGHRWVNSMKTKFSVIPESFHKGDAKKYWNRYCIFSSQKMNNKLT